MVALQLVVVLLALNNALGSSPAKIHYDLENAEEYFEDFIKQHQKKYASEEEKARRFEIFKKKLEEINRLNEENDEIVYGITVFTDATKDEFRRSFGFTESLLRTSVNCTRYTDWDFLTRTAPKHSFDWRQRNVITPVQNQAHCGSCWAFATTGAVEAQYAINHGKLVKLSEQQLVDCVQYTSCELGGNAMIAIDNLMQNGGQMLELDYPYEAKFESDSFPCRFDKSKAFTAVNGCNYYELETEEAVKEALFKKGPLVIAIDGRAMDLFENYKNGVLNHCSDKTNHEVLLVGYGVEKKTPYWILKNSWGASWGEGGYVKVKMGGGCSILGTITSPEVA